MRGKWFVLCILCFLVLVPSVIALKERSLPLVAVGRNGAVEQGQIAHLYLRSIPGNGRVYFATYPLSKYDTQISARIAKEVSCKYVDDDCKNDYVFRLSTDSSIVGGPSAGAAIAILMVGEVLDLPPRQDVTITGTINSGGIVGPVGGVKEKIEAAAHHNISIVLIPRGKRFEENKESDLFFEAQNYTPQLFDTKNSRRTDLYAYGQELGILVREVSSIGDALPYFYNYAFPKQEFNLTLDQSYTDTMNKIGMHMCRKNKNFIAQLNGTNLTEKQQKNFWETINVTERAYSELDDGRSYAAASYCFGANIRYRRLVYRNITDNAFQDKLDELNKKELPVKKDIASLQNMQTWIIVKERYDEAQDWLEDAGDSFEKYKENKSFRGTAIYELSYAEERFYAAESWSLFYDDTNLTSTLNENSLQTSCFDKLQEAMGRYNYANIYFPKYVDGIAPLLDDATNYYQEGEYTQCLFEASLAEAKVDIILNVIGMHPDEVPALVKEKWQYVEQQMSQLPYFPILAYSYYEYSKSLIAKDPVSSLLYAEYALELASLDLYLKGINFESSSTTFGFTFTDSSVLVYPVLMLLVGVMLGIWMQRRRLRKPYR